MKKIALIFLLLAGTCTYAMAQAAAVKEAPPKTKKNSTKADPPAATDNAKVKNSSTGTNKDGTPDMRLKANKEAKAKQAAPAPTPAAQPQAAPAVKTSPQPATNAKPAPTSTDKVTGKDAKGRTIYEGPKGGKYIINGNGNKEYIKKS